ncbi:NACHT, LRR and PYD domains-containing protein 1b allele 2-like [Clarias gariepinus]
MTEHLNQLNVKMQGVENTVLSLQQAVFASENKLELFIADIKTGRLVHFEKLGEFKDACTASDPAQHFDLQQLAGFTSNLLQSFKARFGEFRKRTRLFKFITLSYIPGVFVRDFELQAADLKASDMWCPRAGQFMCKLTNLKFEMEGEVLYSTVSWDSCPLDGLGQSEPAGPLYSINSHEGSIQYLHIPHCETRINEVKLTVAHVSGGNVEIVQPQKVTDTHVIIRIQGLSSFGLLKAWLFQAPPIEAQVLLFYTKQIGEHRMSKLHMHLLPGNVQYEEVQKRDETKTYIEISATCELTPGKKYSPFYKNTDRTIEIQPECQKFYSDYGPNYHPTFEVFFDPDVDKLTLGLWDENKEVVWSRLVFLTTDTKAASPKQQSRTGADFMDQHRRTLIQKVSSVMEIADRLKSKNMITDEMYDRFNLPTLTSQDQMRHLYRILESGGRAVKEEVYKTLKKRMPGLMDDLDPGWMRTMKRNKMSQRIKQFVPRSTCFKFT